MMEEAPRSTVACPLKNIACLQKYEQLKSDPRLLGAVISLTGMTREAFRRTPSSTLWDGGFAEAKSQLEINNGRGTSSVRAWLYYVRRSLLDGTDC